MTRSRGVRPPERKPPKDQSSRGDSTEPHFSYLPPDFCPNGWIIVLACRNIPFGCLRGQFVRSWFKFLELASAEFTYISTTRKLSAPKRGVEPPRRNGGIRYRYRLHCSRI